MDQNNIPNNTGSALSTYFINLKLSRPPFPFSPGILFLRRTTRQGEEKFKGGSVETGKEWRG